MLFEFALQRWPLQRFGIRFFNFMQSNQNSLSYTLLKLTFLELCMKIPLEWLPMLSELAPKITFFIETDDLRKKSKF